MGAQDDTERGRAQDDRGRRHSEHPHAPVRGTGTVDEQAFGYRFTGFSKYGVVSRLRYLFPRDASAVS